MFVNVLRVTRRNSYSPPSLVRSCHVFKILHELVAFGQPPPITCDSAITPKTLGTGTSASRSKKKVSERAEPK